MKNLIEILPNVYGVKVPMEACDFKIEKPFLDKRVYWSAKDNGVSYLYNQILDYGDWKILGTLTKDEISFDASEVVEKVDRSKYNLRPYEPTPFKKYDDDFNQFRGSAGNRLPFYWKAEQSFRSALPDDIYFEHPEGDLKYCCNGRDCGCLGFPINIVSKEHWEEYQTAKENITEKTFNITETMKTLISMTAFVKEQKETSTFDTEQLDWFNKELDCLNNIRNYANFLSQKPEIYMFVPCDENGNVLEEPKNYKQWVKKALNTPYDLDLIKYEQYQQAKERCYFEWFEVDYSNNETDNECIRLKCGKLYITFYENLITVNYPFQDSVHVNTLEYLVPYNLTFKDNFEL